MPYCPYCGKQITQIDARFCPNCGRALGQSSTAAAPSPQAAPAQPSSNFFNHPGIGRTPPPVPTVQKPQHYDLRSILFPSERVAWEVDSKEGLIHRHLNKAYLITNERVIVVDVQSGRVIISLPIRDTGVVVMDRRTNSTSVGSGIYHMGAGSSTRSGKSTSMGSLVFMTNGVERIRLNGIGDPEGVKNLFATIKRENSQMEK
jgi:hypothetical protein